MPQKKGGGASGDKTQIYSGVSCLSPKISNFAIGILKLVAMTKILKLHLLLGCLAIVAIVVACGNTSNTKTANVNGVEWNVSVRKAVQFKDSLTGVNTDLNYTVADTAAVNEKLVSIKPENLTLEWSIPSSDGRIWLVAYESEPILSEAVTVTDAYSNRLYGGNIQVGFRFNDAEKWATITRENIGKRLAVFVNGQLMNAPQVNSEIESGNCSVSIPANMIPDYLPNLDLEKLKQ